MAHNAAKPQEQTIAHFREHGWMRVPGTFDADAAAEMRQAVWTVLAEAGIYRDDPASWTVARPTRLQRLKGNPAFRAVGSPKLFAAIGEVLAGKPFELPKDWGACFVAFPGDAPWTIPACGWHADANYLGPLLPATGVKTLALLGDVAPRGGGTLMVSGSHRLVHGWFSRNPPPPGARGAELRQLLRAHPYIRDLHSKSEASKRVARFMEQSEEVDGILLRVAEATGKAGDVILKHPLVLHVAAPNVSPAPRFLLSGGVTTDLWGWGDGR